MTRTGKPSFSVVLRISQACLVALLALANQAATAQGPSATTPAAPLPFASAVSSLETDPAISKALAEGRLNEAEAMARAAYEKAKENHGAQDKRSARVLAVLAGIITNAGRGGEAEQLYREALQILLTDLDPLDLSVPETVRGLGRSLMIQGRYAEGEKNLRDAFGMIELRIKQLNTLLEPVRSAKTEQERLAVLMNKPELMMIPAFLAKAAIPLVMLYENLASAARAQGRLEEAEALMRQYHTACSPLPPEVRIACDFSLAQVLIETGKLGEAEQLINAVIEQDARQPGTLARPHARKMQGELLLGLNKPEEAMAALHKAVDGFRKTVGPDHFLTLHSQLLLGTVPLRLKRFEEAERILEPAADALAKAFGADHLAALQARWLLALARMQQGGSKLAAAEIDLATALSQSQRSLGIDNQMTLLLAIGNGVVLDRLQRPDHALRVMAGVREAARRSLPVISLEANYVLANLLTRNGKFEEALPLFREGADALEAVFTQTRGLDDAGRGSFVGQFDNLYRDFIGTLLALHERAPGKGHDREVLATASRGQSRLFSEILRQADVARAETSSGFKPLKAAREGLLKKIDLMIAQRGAASSSVEAQAMKNNLTREIESARAELARVEDKLWREFPRYMELVRPRPVTVEQLQKKLLRDDEALLTFALLPDRTVILAVSRKEFRLAVSPLGREALGQKIRAIRAAMEGVDSNGLGILHNLKPEDLHALYRELIAPAMPLLGRFDKWLVVADGPLHTLPFEMLLAGYDERAREAFEARRRESEQGKRSLLDEFAGLDYLGNRHRLSYLPSLSALVSQRQHAKPRPAAFKRQLVAFADPVFGGEAGEKEAPSVETRSALSLLARSLRGGQPLEIPRLDDSADEAREVARAVGGAHQIFQRREAQEFRTKKEDLRSVRYILFATHGFLGGEFSRVAADLGHGAQPPQPALAMTLVGDTQGEDGLLTMKEVVEHLDLNADLVALSACNSAGETVQANTGEGFAGLTRAFMYAGARALLVNHWSVESGSARFLSVRAFSHVRAGMPPAAALARARKEAQASRFKTDTGMQISRAHPFFWAPFVYVGD